MTGMPCKKGDRFDDGAGNISVVTRRSVTDGWADITVTQRGGVSTWTKRMPAGIPATWTPVTDGHVPAEPPADKTHWTIFELRAEAEARFGPDVRDFAYQCPACGDIASVRQFMHFVDPDDERPAARRAGRECIGRTVDGRGCDWTSEGLIAGPWFVDMLNGWTLTAFPLAPAGSVTT